MKIKLDSTVTMHYTLRLEDGSVADSSKHYETPATVKMDDGTLQPALVERLQGLEAGAKERFLIKAMDAFGEHDGRGVMTLPKDRFGDAELEVGVIFEFEQPQGEPLNGIIRAIEGEQVTVDFNHPLAGHDIIFEVEIIAIDPGVVG
ncbi:MAG: peptidylprolyl isomerase [Gammaproteobacteria bacterium CG11_big_fil_rev_8_21_14_0_20_46_22]|nr:MAG: peptidylprolyl isomerase [Gammaproteobacteria bacterium CG12_big_fil_rev_8_21_14_0_65_46_12]PIR11906.1 MAG: peptidylprolyl isomerase [Gammaproteobacteria bacterium CG11_big_fil_rev_8_21_14_0_20_46_22]